MFGRKKEQKKEVTKELETSHNDICAIVIFEVAGKPKEHVEKSLAQYVQNIKKDARIKFIQEHTEEAVEEDGVWSAFSEIEMNVRELTTLTWLAVNFSPASIEIQEPSEKEVTAAEMNAWFNDLLSKIHEISMVHRDTLQKNIKLNESLNALIKNSILNALEAGKLKPEELQKKIGIHKDQLKPFLDNLVEKKRIKVTKGAYSL